MSGSRSVLARVTFGETLGNVLRAAALPLLALGTALLAGLWAGRVVETSATLAADSFLNDPQGRAVRVVLYGFLPTALLAVLGVSVLYWRALLSRAHAIRTLVARMRRLRSEVNRDPLTNLLNRREFFAQLDERLLVAREGRPLALLLVDLDGFKTINDTYGHETGDGVLSVVGERLERLFGIEAGFTGRLGGDEFAVALLGVDAEAAAHAAAEQVIAACAKAVTTQGRVLHVGASVGYTLAPLHGTGRFDVMRQADAALYAAKSRGRGTAAPFDPEMEVEVRHRRFMERELKAALLCGEIEPYYQAIFSADGRRQIGAEALVRWRHAVRGHIPPAEFIPIAEKANLIEDLGAYVLRRACLDARAWPETYLAVNLSPLQIMRGNIVGVVAEALRDSGIDPGRLVLEITESAFLDESERSLATLERLRGLGVQIALDDFGTGYSSLGYLQRFRFDKLKIDQSFVAGLAVSADAATIIHAIVSLGRGLGMTVTAEGVETAEQHRFLMAAGCHEMQGYHFARPENAAATARRVRGAPPLHPVALRVAS